MKLLILGAGASWGSTKTRMRPALTKYLLPEFQRLYPETWGGITEEFAASCDHNFEIIMGHLLNQWDSRPFAHAWIMNQHLGHYFARFVPDDESLYVRLMRDVDLSSVVVCTLNYDLLLQRAAARFNKSFYVTGFEFDNGRPVLQEQRPGSIELLLPHGSAGLVETSGRFQRNYLSSRNVIEFTQTRAAKICLDLNEMQGFYERFEPNPVMSFIHPAKTATFAEPNLERVRTRLADVCRDCDGIAIVGVSYSEDEHIFGPIRDSKVPIMLAVGGGNGGMYYTCACGLRVNDTRNTWFEAFEKIARFLTE